MQGDVNVSGLHNHLHAEEFLEAGVGDGTCLAPVLGSRRGSGDEEAKIKQRERERERERRQVSMHRHIA